MFAKLEAISGIKTTEGILKHERDEELFDIAHGMSTEASCLLQSRKTEICHQIHQRASHLHQIAK